MASGPGGAELARQALPGEIPVIDFTAYFQGRSGALEELSRQVVSASETVGFYYLRGAKECIARLPRSFEICRGVHQLPREKREQIDSAHDRAHMGYVFGYEGASEEGDSISAVEEASPGFDQAKFTAQGSMGIYMISKGHGRSLEDQQRVSPSEQDVPGFAEGLRNFFEVMDRLVSEILPVYAHALRMPSAELLARFQDPRGVLTLNHYPPRPKERPDWNGIAMHADCTFITLLAQDQVPGLQIMLPDGTWLKAPVVDDCFLVNTGEFLKRLTNGHWLNTVHKVVPPTDRDRYSVGYFVTQDKKFAMAPLPHFCSEKDPPAYEPFTHQSFFTSGETPYTVGARELENRRRALAAGAVGPGAGAGASASKL